MRHLKFTEENAWSGPRHERAWEMFFYRTCDVALLRWVHERFGPR